MANPIKTILTLCLLVLPAVATTQSAAEPDGLELVFADNDPAFDVEAKRQIEDIVMRTESEVRNLLPDLPNDIVVDVSSIARDLTEVGGVTGRADDPRKVVVYVSTSFAGGVMSAIDTGLAAVLYHEFHHLARGWTIEGNKFGPGIRVAAINEGLANVFSELYTNTAFPGNAYPENVGQWWQEIEALPLDANYSQWIVEHTDGRQAVGYKAGSYMVRRILEHSGLTVLELSAMSVEEILALAEELR